MAMANEGELFYAKNMITSTTLWKCNIDSLLVILLDHLIPYFRDRFQMQKYVYKQIQEVAQNKAWQIPKISIENVVDNGLATLSQWNGTIDHVEPANRL